MIGCRSFCKTSGGGDEQTCGGRDVLTPAIAPANDSNALPFPVAARPPARSTQPASTRPADSIGRMCGNSLQPAKRRSVAISPNRWSGASTRPSSASRMKSSVCFPDELAVAAHLQRRLVPPWRKLGNRQRDLFFAAQPPRAGGVRDLRRPDRWTTPFLPCASARQRADRSSVKRSLTCTCTADPIARRKMLPGRSVAQRNRGTCDTLMSSNHAEPRMSCGNGAPGRCGLVEYCDG